MTFVTLTHNLTLQWTNIKSSNITQMLQLYKFPCFVKRNTNTTINQINRWHIPRIRSQFMTTMLTKGNENERKYALRCCIERVRSLIGGSTILSDFTKSTKLDIKCAKVDHGSSKLNLPEVTISRVKIGQKLATHVSMEILV